MRIQSMVVALSRVVLLWAAACSTVVAGDASAALDPVSQRFAAGDVEETPSFQRHVSPLLGRLGCNGRACHGSFQGRGGFRLSLFGYDFKMDHAALLDPQSSRVDLQHPLDSLILNKPTNADEHEGGQRYQKGSWQHHLLRNWVLGGAAFEEAGIEKLVRLEVQPRELVFDQAGSTARVNVTAVWPDGTREDVTPLSRFQTNDEQIAQVDSDGVVTAGEVGDTHVVVFYDNAVVPIPVIRPVSEQVGARFPQVPTPTRIDELVVEKLKKVGIVPSELCSDEEFLRRVYLDLTGTLPSAQAVQRFLADPSPSKRRDMIDQLLETPAYAAWWTTRLCDYTGNNADKLRNAAPLRGRASEDWYQWIYKRVAENQPYDKLVEGIVLATSRRPGQSYREFADEMSEVYRQDSAAAFAQLPSLPHYWARQDFTAPEDRAVGFAYSFLGIRIQCAQCHKHPFDQWSKDDFEQFQQFFTVVSRGNVQGRDPQTRRQYQELVKELGLEDQRGNQLRREFPRLLNEGKTVPFPEVHLIRAPVRAPLRRNGQGGPGATARLLGDETIRLADYEDPRTALMDWMRGKDNPYFAPALVNRVWANYFNVGIVQPPDDLSLANPPSNRPLLEYLSRQFIEHGFDMKWLHREIANSRTYQLSWRPNDTNRSDQRNFSHAIPRRLPAEVAYDAVRAATLNDERANTLLQDLEDRAIAVATVGARNGGRAGAGFALQVFGQSRRDGNCDCDRSPDPTLLQTVFLQNDRDVHTWLNQARIGWLDQLARQHGTTIAATPGAARVAGPDISGRPALEQQVRNVRRRLQQARQAGDEQTVNMLRRRLRLLTVRIGGASAPQGTAPDVAPAETTEAEVTGPADRDTAPAIDVQQVVQSAYLRTLSRYPTDSEMETCVAFFDESENKISAARDLLWALINTKEFIVNH